MIPELLFWSSVFLILYTYVIYVWILSLLSYRKKENPVSYRHEDEVPRISVIMSVYNEENVIKKKLESIYFTSFPMDKFEVLVGSDCSTDNTDRICRIYCENYENLKFFPFPVRQGKPSVVNQLALKATGELLVITDANVMLGYDTLFELTRHFRNGKVGLVDSNVMHHGLNKEGISIQENAYKSREVKVKHLESLNWGCMMGPSGGCYAVRKGLFEPVPGNFLADDFYISMKVLSKGKKAINSMKAVVMEDITNELFEEFRRKVRIAAGNFQNLVKFLPVLAHPFTPRAFCFFSHKILRWIGPLLMITAVISSLFLADQTFFRFVIIAEAILFLLPVVDYLLKKIKIHVIILRFITHFLAMNLALLVGLIRFIRGIETNIWQPTKRIISERI
jgi:cellulose synthase/poly-beta-1,6-N-acetylglucosamine synthase-like glycosyltransferase